MASRERREPRGRNVSDARRLPCLTHVAVSRAQGPQERLERLLRMLLHRTRPDDDVFGAVGHRSPQRSWDESDGSEDAYSSGLNGATRESSTQRPAWLAWLASHFGLLGLVTPDVHSPVDRCACYGRVGLKRLPEPKLFISVYKLPVSII